DLSASSVRCSAYIQYRTASRMDISPTGESGETATCPLMLKSTLEPRDSPVQCKKKYANQHWPAEHLNKQPSVIFKVTTVITPTIAIDNQASWVALPECPCSPGHRTDKPDTPPVLAGCWRHDHPPHGGNSLPQAGIGRFKVLNVSTLIDF